MITQGAQSPRLSVIIMHDGARKPTAPPDAAVIEGDMKFINVSSKLDGYYTCADQTHHRAPQSAWIKNGGMLFNLTADPNEQHNLIDDLPEVVTRLQQLLAKAASTAVPSVSHDVDPAAEQWQEAHNNTLGPWADGAA